MSGIFYHLGRQLGRKAVPVARKGKLIWQGVTGDDAESWQAEQALGREMADELRSTLDASAAAELLVFVREVAGRLQEALPSPAREFSCELFRSSTPQAMALPGGWIFLSEALVRGCGTRDDELAFLLGHEMGHIILKHSWNRLISDAALRVFSTAATRAGPVGQWVKSQGIELLRGAHSRECEFQADKFAYKLGAAAAFGLDGPGSLFARLEAASNAGIDLGPYFASHPAPGHRLGNLRRRPGGSSV